MKTLIELNQELNKFGLSEKDFNFEFINYIENEYFDVNLINVKINGYIYKIKTSVNTKIMQDLKFENNYDVSYIFEEILKIEAISWYLNNPKIIRKHKLLQINKNK